MVKSHAEKMLKRIQLPNVYWETRLSKVSECEGKKILTDWIMPMSKEGSGLIPKKGLYIYGEFGRGKSAAAAIALKACLAKGKFGLWVNFSDICNFVKYEDKYKYSENESMLDRMKTCDILVLDEFSITSKDWFPIQTFEMIVRDRVRNVKPLIVTSNHSPSSLKKTDTAEQRKIAVQVEGLVSILQEAVSGCMITGKNWRKG